VSLQRRRGQKARVWKQKVIEDSRGNRTLVADDTDVIEVTAAFIPQRSAKAEVPGQMQINVVRMIVDPHLEDVGLWSRVEYQGKQWDIVSPPSYHAGSRHTQHWSMDLRERP
jgi:hypothetical protein